MRLQITGATGYIGRHVVKHALAAGYDVELITRAALPDGIYTADEVKKLRIQQVDDICNTKADPSARLIHMAWDNVGSYKDPRLMTQTLPHQLNFLTHMAQNGCEDMTIAGTCLEYGLTEGPCKEDAACLPVTYYGLAKHSLYTALSIYARQHKDLRIKWLRYFYIYGPGQRKGSLFGQLAEALRTGQKEFPMSPADQQRDFIHVETAAYNTLKIAAQDAVDGIVNVGNGQPVTVLDQASALKGGADLQFKTGVYPYADYEPFAFWADTHKLKSIPGVKFDEKNL